MLTLDAFRPEHLARFSPGEPELEWWGTVDLPAVMSEYPTVAVLRDGEPHAFLGVRPFNGAMHAWSMWSAEARAAPFALSRFLKLHAGWLLDMHGASDAVAMPTNAKECRLAEWMRFPCPS